MKTLQPSSLIYAEHASDILAKGADLAKAGRPFALITSLAIEGGAAREVGSLALVEDCGAMTGYLSNGCIDRDIQHHAVDSLESKKKKLIRYGDGSRYIDLKLPCGGALTVLIDPSPDTSAIIDAASALQARQSVSVTFHVPEDDDPELSRTFTYAPRHRLVLAGRGAIFRSMAQLGHTTGFDVHLMSPEMNDLDAVGHFSGGQPLHLTSPNARQSLGMLDADSAFITLFHDHEWEPYLLCAALDTPARFIGSLGSRRTHTIRKEALRQMQVPEGELARLNGPIGLVPSLRDASSIAVSSLAEVCQAFQDRGAKDK